MRRFFLTVNVIVATMFSVAGVAMAGPPQITRAYYDEPTTRYPHGALGDDTEYGALVLVLSNGQKRRIRLPDTSVFEDTAPRLADLDGDGAPEVITVEALASQGARLAVFGADGLFAATEPIGTRFRWLAPAGIGDLDGDGRVEIAYVDRPHLAKVLRVVRFNDGQLQPIAARRGFSNHQFGAPDIVGGLRHCGDRTEVILASGDWQSLMAVELADQELKAARLGPYSATAIERALECRD